MWCYLFLFYLEKMNSLKPILSTIGSIVLVWLLALIWYEAYHAYMINHTYYYDMIKDSNNRTIILWFILLSIIPIGVLVWKKTISVTSLSRSLLSSLLLSWFVHTSLKGWLVWSTGSFIFLFNTLVLLSLIIVFFWGIYAIGTKIYHYFLKRDLSDWTDILLALWFGLGAFLLLNYLLLILQLFNPIITRLQFVALWYSIRYYRDWFTSSKKIIHDVFKSFSWLDTHRKTIYAILLAATIIYVMLSFNLSFIPYSTAWDANHAYMYFPKVWALNHGVFFTEGPVASPMIWMVYISYWFSLFQPLTSFTLVPDTVAVVMNNISGWLSLVFGLGALYKVINFFKNITTKLEDSFFHTALSLWWMYFLLWLMSGMGAFLVFVDNKTDLGVMSLTMLALMSGFIFLEHVGEIDQKTHTTQEIRDYSTYGIISGFFFALAIMAKPTAFQDFLIFGLLLAGLWIGMRGLLWWFLMVLWILWRAETMSIVFYINKSLATKLWIAGLFSLVWQGIITFRQNSWKWIRPLWTWIATILIILIVFKWGYILTQQIISNTVDTKVLVKGILLGKKDNNQTKKLQHVLLADSGDSITIDSLSGTTNTNTIPSLKPASCNLQQAGLSQDTLYTWLLTIQWWGLVEDLWRYIGFGQRTFSDPRSRPSTEKKDYSFVRIGYPIVKLFFHTPWCYSFNTAADALCEQPALSTSKEWLESILSNTEVDSNQYKFISGVIAQYNSIDVETDENRKQSLQKDIQKSLTDYIQGNVIQVTKDNNGYTSIAVPYAFLTPLNVIFNRSLQNLSSYYTDIGFVWILSLVLLIAGTLYALFTQDKKLIVLHIVTLCGWIIWWFIASGIIWYAVGIIAWTTFCNALYLSKILHNNKDTDTIGQRTSRIIIGIVVLAAIIQTSLNLFRIASQWGSGPFTWYKWWTGKENIFIFTAQGLQQKEIIRNRYTASDVFNLQFGHYNTFMNYVENRKDEDGVLIAGTYLQYFLKNQNNIVGDGLLTEFWKRGSDENTCNLALRLQDKKVKYLVIDPNIWSVVMWGWNSSLFDRFVAKIDSKTNKIITHGTMTMLAKMIQDWYLKLIMSNNMGAKYAYTLTDTELQTSIQSIPDETTKSYLTNAFTNEPLLFRSKLAVPRFFGEESQYYFVLIWAIFQQRLSQPTGIDDLANILGKNIDNNNVLAAIQALNKPTQSSLIGLNKQLNDDERTVLWYYSAITQRQQAKDTKGLQEIISQLLQASLAWGSQLITFELQI